MYNQSGIDNIDYVLISSVSHYLSYCIDGRIKCNIYRKPVYISYCYVCQTSTSFVITLRTMSIIVLYQALCKDFSLLSVLVSIIILHVSYQLF